MTPRCTVVSSWPPGLWTGQSGRRRRGRRGLLAAAEGDGEIAGDGPSRWSGAWRTRLRWSVAFNGALSSPYANSERKSARLTGGLSAAEFRGADVRPY